MKQFKNLSLALAILAMGACAHKKAADATPASCQAGEGHAHCCAAGKDSAMPAGCPMANEAAAAPAVETAKTKHKKKSKAKVKVEAAAAAAPAVQGN
jgi:hypothetical protein